MAPDDVRLFLASSVKHRDDGHIVSLSMLTRVGLRREAAYPGNFVFSSFLLGSFKIRIVGNSYNVSGIADAFVGCWRGSRCMHTISPLRG